MDSIDVVTLPYESIEAAALRCFGSGFEESTDTVKRLENNPSYNTLCKDYGTFGICHFVKYSDLSTWVHSSKKYTDDALADNKDYEDLCKDLVPDFDPSSDNGIPVNLFTSSVCP